VSIDIAELLPHLEPFKKYSKYCGYPPFSHEEIDWDTSWYWSGRNGCFPQGCVDNSVAVLTDIGEGELVMGWYLTNDEKADLHCWVQMADGTILDPTIARYTRWANGIVYLPLRAWSHDYIQKLYCLEGGKLPFYTVPGWEEQLKDVIELMRGKLGPGFELPGYTCFQEYCQMLAEKMQQGAPLEIPRLKVTCRGLERPKTGPRADNSPSITGTYRAARERFSTPSIW
jgi:hypothetical protein